MKNIKIQSKLTNLNQKAFLINNTQNDRYQIKTIVIRQGQDTNNGHYKIWCRNLQNNKWLYINDHLIRQYDQLYDSLDNVVLIIFQKVLNP